MSGVADLTRDERRLQERWGQWFPADELRVLAAAGYGRRMGYGSRPALAVVDVTYGFCGREPKPILEAIDDGRRSCGDRAWARIGAMRALLDSARRAQVPVVFSAMRDPSSPAFEPGLWGEKNHRSAEDAPRAGGGAGDNDVVEELAPRPGELVLAKDKPSLFHGTGLLPYLVGRGVDSLIVCGGATSGCVYATALDAFSYNLRVAVVADACFDRVDTPHWAALLDIDMKYGVVVDSADAVAHLDRQGARR